MLCTHLIHAAVVLSPLITSAFAASLYGADTVGKVTRSTADDIQTVTERRFATIVGATTGASSISTW